MLQLGIFSKDQIPLGPPSRRERPIAFTLLADFVDPLTENDEVRLGRLLHTMSAGTNVKWTYAHRYKAIDEIIEAEIKARFDGGPLRIRELAASNAITSLELFERLRSRESVSVVATDFFDAVYVSAAHGWKVVFDAEGNPLQFLGRPLVIGAQSKERWANRQLRKWLRAKVLPEAVSALRNGNGQRLALFHPRCLRTAEQDSRFVLRREDAFNPGIWVCEVLRIMGFGNSIRPELTEVFFRRIANQIVPGGLLVVGDQPCEENEVAVTIFERAAGQLRPIHVLGGGYSRQRTLEGLRLG